MLLVHPDRAQQRDCDRQKGGDKQERPVLRKVGCNCATLYLPGHQGQGAKCTQYFWLPRIEKMLLFLCIKAKPPLTLTFVSPATNSECDWWRRRSIRGEKAWYLKEKLLSGIARVWYINNCGSAMWRIHQHLDYVFTSYVDHPVIKLYGAPQPTL